MLMLNIRLIEGGFVEKWRNDEMNKVARVSKSKSDKTKARPITTNDLQAPIFAFALMNGAAILTFAFEKMRKGHVRLIKGHNRGNGPSARIFLA